MPVNYPYRRTCRQFSDGKYAFSGRWKYIIHTKYAQYPSHYIRSFLLLQEDLKDLFQYIEPADKNLHCYSFRTHSLLFRACVEVEANCKAILKENGYSKNDDQLNIRDYNKINYSHLLSDYQVKLPRWSGKKGVRRPFKNWDTDSPLPWYQAYNSTKHNRQEEFENATFEHMLDAICGVLVLLSAQFYTTDFSPGPDYLASSGNPYWSDNMESGVGEYFRIKFPDNWPKDLEYDFDWKTIKDENDPFQEFDYTKVKLQS